MGKEHAGLVVDPGIAVNVFRDAKKGQSAIKAWASFLGSHGALTTEELNQNQLLKGGTILVKQAELSQIDHVDRTKTLHDNRITECIKKMSRTATPGRCYLVDRNRESRHYGCLTLNGKYLYGDYDLKDIIDCRQPGRVVALSGILHGQPICPQPN